MKKSVIAVCLLGAALCAFASEPVFPAIKFELIGGEFISLPSGIESDAVLVALSFKRPSDGIVESWTNTYSVRFKGRPAAYYQVAVIGDAGFIGGFILGGMRSGATEEQKKHLAICWEDKNEQKKKFGVEDDSLIYVFLLDSKGRIVLSKKGLKASDEDISEIISETEKLLKPKTNKGAK
jgi:hypothetical protein